jgi:hypothetical protein
MPKYYLTGLMYINGCNGDDQRVLIPDGSNDLDIQPPLSATMLVAKNERKDDTFGTAWRPRVLMVDGQPKDFYEFILKKRSRVSVSGSNGGAQCSKLDTGLPRAQVANFVPNLVDPDTIAEIELSGGKVTARRLGDVTPIVEWIVDDKRDDAIITATLLDEDRQPTAEKQTLTVSSDATIVFVHSSDLFAVPQPEDERKVASTEASESDEPPEPRYIAGAKLYSKISRPENPVDPTKFYFNRKARHPEDAIPDSQLSDVLKGLRNQPGWDTSDPNWCCA